MSDRSQIIAYLTPPKPSFWRWEDDGKSVCWSGRGTLAFRQELASIVTRLAPRGLPPFEAIILLTAATRDNFAVMRDHISQHLQQITLAGVGDSVSSTGVILRAIGHRLEADCKSMMDGLDIVHALSKDFRVPLAAKALLAEMVFESVKPVVQSDVAGAIAAELSEPREAAEFEVAPQGRSLREFVAALESLRPGLEQVDPQRLELRLKTGMDALPKPADIKLPVGLRVRQLLNDLIDDPELGRLAQLARDLLAAVWTPRTPRQREDYPVGGVSDISNRGPLDRLLISELAQDDLTLAVRVALNEALYLQREYPRKDPPRHRVILLDLGIRTWGVPRVYATAIALALAATGDRAAEVSAYRPDGKHLRPVDLTSRQGLIDHLAALDPRSHFAESLDALRQASPGLAEVFLVTQQDVLADRELRTAMAAQEDFSGFAAAVDRDGGFRLSSFSPAGHKVLRQAMLDVSQLLEPPKNPRQLLLADSKISLPVIFSTKPFPLLLPAGNLRKCVRDRQGGYIGITRDRRLLHWRKPDEGGLQLAASVPFGAVNLFHVTQDRRVVLLCTDTGKHSSPRNTRMMIANLEDGEIQTHDLVGGSEVPSGAAVRDDVLFVIGQKGIRIYSLTTGQFLREEKFKGFTWVRGRIFSQRPANFIAVAYNGATLTAERIPDHPRKITIFESPAIDGPLVLTDDGTIARAGEPDAILWKGIGQKIAPYVTFSDDGAWLAIRSSGKSGVQYAIDTTAPGRKRWAPVKNFDQLANGPSFLPQVRDTSLIITFSDILVDASGTLLLIKPQGERYAIRLVGGQIRLVPDTNPELSDVNRVRNFTGILPPDGARYLLKVAAWENGSRAFLDHRGMLHLKDARQEMPEITLVLLTESPLAGWSSDAWYYGPAIWHGSKMVREPKHLYELLQQFTQDLR